MLASLSSPPSALPSPGARLSCRGVALLVIGAHEALLLGQERVEWKHGYRLPLIEVTQHVACDHQREAGDSECLTMTRHFLSSKGKQPDFHSALLGLTEENISWKLPSDAV